MAALCATTVAACDDRTPGGGDGGADAEVDAGTDGSADGDVPDAPAIPGAHYLVPDRVIDGISDSALEGYAVAIRDGTIVEVAPAAPTPPGYGRVDLPGVTLAPGLIDAHVHVATGGVHLQTVLDDFLRHGVTTVRDLGGPLDRTVTLRRLVASGTLVGPRVLLSGPFVTSPHGHPIHTVFSGDGSLLAQATRAPRDPADAAAAVAALAAAGVDWIKLVLTDCPGWELACDRMSAEVAQAAVAEARVRGLRVAVHTDGPEDVRAAIGMGVDTIEHGVTDRDPDPSLAEEAARAGLRLVPTATAYRAVPRDALVRRVAAWRAAGVVLVAGSGYGEPGVLAGRSLHDELALLVEAGATPMEALHAATRHAAEALGVDALVGTVEPGKRADLIGLRGNPLHDVGLLEHPVLTLRDGAPLWREEP